MENQNQENPAILEGKYLTFSLAEEEYGIGILKVKEIIGMMPITGVPKTPAFVKGVINLRGKVIPIVDLRLKFDLAEAEHDDRTCIIVVEVLGSSGQIQIGIVVDSVSEGHEHQGRGHRGDAFFRLRPKNRIHSGHGQD